MSLEVKVDEAVVNFDSMTLHGKEGWIGIERGDKGDLWSIDLDRGNVNMANHPMFELTWLWPRSAKFEAAYQGWLAEKELFREQET